MKDSLTPGVFLIQRIQVDKKRTIAFLGEEGRVYSTPAMVKDIEYASLQLLHRYLDQGESSVGVHVSVDHLGATPLEAWVEIRVEIETIDRRKVRLSAEVRDSFEIVGKGIHERFVIDVLRHRKRLVEKIANLTKMR